MTSHLRSTPALVALAFIASAGCAHAHAAGPSSMTNDMSGSHSKQLDMHAAATPASASESDIQGQKDLQAAIDDMKGTRIFFGYDDDGITPEGRAKLATIGDILYRHPNLRIRIEGNCDERGTEAYNLVLGQRRADSARKYLTSLGAGPQQVATVSYGAERPVQTGHTEQAWQQNRRDDFVVVAGQN